MLCALILAHRLQESLEFTLKGQIFTLALDCGTIHKKIQMICFKSQKMVYFVTCCKVVHIDHPIILVKASWANFGANLLAVEGDNHIGLQNVSSVERESSLRSLQTPNIFCSKRKQ